MTWRRDQSTPPGSARWTRHARPAPACAGNETGPGRRTPTGPEDGRPCLLFHGGGQTRHAWAARPGCSGTRAGGPPPSTCVATATATGAGRRRLQASTPSRPTCRAVARRDRHLAAGARDRRLARRADSARSRSPRTRGHRHRSPGGSCWSTSPHLEQEGPSASASSCSATSTGSPASEEVADAVAAYNPHRPRPRTCRACARTSAARGRPLVLALGPAVPESGSHDEPRSSATRTASRAAARRSRCPLCSCGAARATSCPRRAPADPQALVPHARLRRRRRRRPHGRRRPQRRLQRRGRRVPRGDAPGLTTRQIELAAAGRTPQATTSSPWLS